MNSLNEQRANVVAELLFNLRPDDTTPTTDFNVSPEYTLIAHLPEHINDSIYAIASKLKEQFPEHYYYSPDQYHLTVVPIPYSMNPARIIESIAPVVRGWHLPIHARGVVANRLQAGVVLYPEEETLSSHRLKLRAALDIPEQAFTAHNPVWEELLWSNFMRFTAKPEEELLAFLRAHINQDLGSFVLSKYELYEVSTKTLDPTSSKILHTFGA
jgi:hypothetical protein